MFETADWSHRGDYIAKHGVTTDEADEALAAPDRVVIKPDRRRSQAAVSASSAT
ncbi:hypothetical protein [Mycobacterium sp.]|uniref:hypothetical protein n=1 Tax=Mycobacterium sp. TaxID=1785 RepID=UPI003F9992FB